MNCPHLPARVLLKQLLGSSEPMCGLEHRRLKDEVEEVVTRLLCRVRVRVRVRGSG